VLQRSDRKTWNYYIKLYETDYLLLGTDHQFSANIKANNTTWFGKLDGRNMSELVPARPHIKHTHCVRMNRECKLARNSLVIMNEVTGQAHEFLRYVPNIEVRRTAYF
jgi:hypothetical protein